MNSDEVKKALNVDPRVGKWIGCGGITYLSLKEASYWIYPILRKKYKILIFSGDTDGIIPTYGTRLWIKDLGWNIMVKEKPWFIDGQVAGYIENYDGLDFATVHGAGHLST